MLADVFIVTTVAVAVPLRVRVMTVVALCSGWPVGVDMTLSVPVPVGLGLLPVAVVFVEGKGATMEVPPVGLVMIEPVPIGGAVPVVAVGKILAVSLEGNPVPDGTVGRMLTVPLGKGNPVPVENVGKLLSVPLAEGIPVPLGTVGKMESLPLGHSGYGTYSRRTFNASAPPVTSTVAAKKVSSFIIRTEGSLVKNRTDR